MVKNTMTRGEFFKIAGFGHVVLSGYFLDTADVMCYSLQIDTQILRRFAERFAETKILLC
jgi:hypothetical protein